ncbi:MAG: GNAT family N-acetyltransferase [Waterburya sp.]
MNKFNIEYFQSYSLPSGYTIRPARKQDYSKIYRQFFSIGQNVYFLGFLSFFISLFFTIPLGYSDWQMLQKSIQFEGGQPLEKPNFTGFIFIIFRAIPQSLMFVVITIIVSIFISYLLNSHLYNLFVLRNQENNPNYWIILYRNKIVGVTMIKMEKHYSKLLFLLIQPKHRKQGLGSYLLYKATENAQKPIYLFCFAKLESFYRRLGFISIGRRQIPAELRPGFFDKVMIWRELL